MELLLVISYWILAIYLVISGITILVGRMPKKEPVDPKYAGMSDQEVLNAKQREYMKTNHW